MMLLCLMNIQFPWPLTCQKVSDFLSSSDGVEEESAQGVERGNFGEATEDSDAPAVAIRSAISLVPILKDSASPSTKWLISSISSAWVSPPTGRGFTLPVACRLLKRSSGLSGKLFTTPLFKRWSPSLGNLSLMSPSLAEKEWQKRLGS